MSYIISFIAIPDLLQSGVPEENVITAQNTIDVEHIVERELSFLPKDFNHGTTRILYVGALAPQKRIESSIEAVAQLIDEGIDLQYDIVGGGTHLGIIKGLWDKLPEKLKV